MVAFVRAVLDQFQPSNPRIQVLSDLHLEVGQQYSSFNFPAVAPFLLLAGDIGRLADYDAYLEFLQRQTSRYQKVFLLLGNHEFYGLDHESGLAKAQELWREPSIASRLVLLDRIRWDDTESNLTILGCTLWSAIPESTYDIVKSKVKDYKNITDWTPEKHNQVHARELDWLRNQVAQVRSNSNDRRRLLVATHHAPCIEGTSRPEQRSNPWTPAFATDLLDMEGAWDGVNVWVFGHTHFSTTFSRRGIRLVANQRGYVLPGTDKKLTSFDDERVITV